MLLAWLLSSFQTLSPLPTSKLGPIGADSQVGEWVCVCSRTSWVSPMNSLVRPGVSPTSANPTGFYSQRFLGCSFPHWNPGLHSLSCSPVVPSGLSTHKYVTTLIHQLQPCSMSSLPQQPASPPPTDLNECFFFNSLVVRLPYSSIFYLHLGQKCLRAGVSNSFSLGATPALWLPSKGRM